MREREPALEVDGIRLSHGAVGGEFDRRALDEVTGRHDDEVVIAVHGSGHGSDVTVHRGGGLDAGGEGEHRLLRAEFDGLDDVVAGLRGGRYDVVAELLVSGCHEDGALHRRCDHRRRKEEALVQSGVHRQGRADVLAEARRAEPVETPVHAGPRARNIPAGGRNAAARVLDERPDDHVRTHIGGFDSLGEFSIAVVDHDEDVRFQLFDKLDEFADLLDRERRPHLVALGPLDGDEFRLLVDRGPDAVPVEGPVVQKVDLSVRDAVLGERAGGLPDADDLFERVIRLPHRAQ